jgi:hypothetical protein
MIEKAWNLRSFEEQLALAWRFDGSPLRFGSHRLSPAPAAFRKASAVLRDLLTCAGVGWAEASIALREVGLDLGLQELIRQANDNAGEVGNDVIASRREELRREEKPPGALGARPRIVVAMVVRQAMTWTAIGGVIGMTLAFLLTRFLEALLYGINPADPATFGGVLPLLAGVTFVAALVPALRARWTRARRCESPDRSGRRFRRGTRALSPRVLPCAACPSIRTSRP